MKFKNLFFILLPFISFGQENLSTIVNPKMALSIHEKRIKKPNEQSLANKELSRSIIEYEQNNNAPFFTGVPNFYYNYEIVEKKIDDEFVIKMLDTRNGDLFDLKGLITIPKDKYILGFYNNTINFRSKKSILEWNEEEKKFTILDTAKPTVSTTLDPKLVISLEKKYKTRFQNGEGGALQIQGDNIVLSVNGKEMLFDINGNELSKPIYDEISSLFSPIVNVRKDKLHGILDSEGKTIFPTIYESQPIGIGGGLYYTSVSGGKKIINLKGEELKKETFSEVGRFHSGLAKVKIGSKCGYLDINGDAIIPKIYEYCKDFSEDLASVERDRKCGYISVDGTELISLTSFENCGDFRYGMAEITIKNGKGLIDKTGKIIAEPTYDLTKNFNEEITRVTKNGKSGLIDRNGNIIIPIIYDEVVKTYRPDTFVVKINGKWGGNE